VTITSTATPFQKVMTAGSAADLIAAVPVPVAIPLRAVARSAAVSRTAPTLRLLAR